MEPWSEVHIIRNPVLLSVRVAGGMVWPCIGTPIVEGSIDRIVVVVGCIDAVFGVVEDAVEMSCVIPGKFQQIDSHPII